MLNPQYGNTIKMGACVDDRNFRGDLEKLEEVCQLISEFDRRAGHRIQPKKTTLHVTDRKQAAEAQYIIFDGRNPRVNESETLIGEPVSIAGQHCNRLANSRISKAITTARKIWGYRQADAENQS